MSQVIKNTYFINIIIFSGLATEFSRSQEGVFIIFLCSIFMLLYYKVPIRKKLLYVIGIWFLYCIIVFIRNGIFTPFFNFRYFAYILITYTIIQIYRDDLFHKYENIVTILSGISLVLFSWLVLFPESLLSIARILDISGDIDRNSDEYIHFLLYTVEIFNGKIQLRNYGFVFEPGVYSIFLIVSIFLNLLRTNVKLVGNLNLWILTIALFTTFSTTGYLALGVLVIYLSYSITNSYRTVIYSLVFVTIFLYAFFEVDIMQDKIIELYISGQNIEETITHSAQTGISYSAGRFGGFYIGWQDFKEFPLLGRGGVTDLSYGRSGQANVYIVNGLANIMSQFGIFGLLVYVIVLYKSSVTLAILFSSNAKYAFLIIILISTFSFSVHHHFIIFSFVFSSIFIKKLSP